MPWLRFDRFELDEADARLTCAGQPVPLAPKPFAVLCALARSPRKLVTKNALARRRLGPSLRHRIGAQVRDQRSARGARRRPEAAALHRDGVAPRLSLHRRRPARRAQPQIAGALETVMSLCRSDAALADLIRSVAATLERERLAVNDS